MYLNHIFYTILCIKPIPTGAGLSPQQLLEIGAEGVQFNANQLQAGQGSGLGLFISKGICTQHGGTFQVTSQVQNPYP
jgi:signal transduction histidine kinase